MKYNPDKNNSFPTAFSLLQPDDAHVHFRDGLYLQTTVPATAKQFGRAIVMPNLKSPITTLEMLRDYKKRILACIPAGNSFQPLMTLYLTDYTTSEEIIAAAHTKEVMAVKLYPAGATTYSKQGVQALDRLDAVFETMQKVDMPLLIHGEVNTPEVDIFERECRFLDWLAKLLKKFPALRVVLEHITTEEAVDFISTTPYRLAATITPHHLLLNRNDLFEGGIQPHHYCLPILKHHRHQTALIAAAISGKKSFFLGTDSAPHTIQTKETACGCAGIYSAHAAMELYISVFSAHQALDKLNAFASHYAADFYGLPRATDTIHFTQTTWEVPKTLPFGKDKVVPFFAGKKLYWKQDEPKKTV